MRAAAPVRDGVDPAAAGAPEKGLRGARESELDGLELAPLLIARARCGVAAPSRPADAVCVRRRRGSDRDS